MLNLGMLAHCSHISCIELIPCNSLICICKMPKDDLLYVTLCRALYTADHDVQAPNTKPRMRALLHEMNTVRDSLQNDGGYGYADQHEDDNADDLYNHEDNVAAKRIGYKVLQHMLPAQFVLPVMISRRTPAWPPHCLQDMNE